MRASYFQMLSAQDGGIIGIAKYAAIFDGSNNMVNVPISGDMGYKYIADFIG